MKRMKYNDFSIQMMSSFLGTLSSRDNWQKGDKNNNHTGRETVPVMGLDLLCYLLSQETQGRPELAPPHPHRHLAGSL